MHRLVAAAAAGQDRHLARDRRIGTGDKHRLLMHQQLWVRLCQPQQLLFQYRLNFIDQFFHGYFLVWPTGRNLLRPCGISLSVVAARHCPADLPSKWPPVRWQA
ncbi:hypothetical protein D3C72_1981310 [compost metagenome]